MKPLRNHIQTRTRTLLSALAIALTAQLGWTSPASAAEVATEHFKIELPDHFVVETDHTSRILGFSSAGPQAPPFLSIEFSTQMPWSQVLESIQHTTSQHDASVVETVCEPPCTAAFHTWFSEQIDDLEVQAHFYVGLRGGLVFVISYVDHAANDAARGFVTDLAEQILRYREGSTD